MYYPQRALGLSWCAQTDDFTFTVEIKGHMLSRLVILSTISSIYDPLGFIVPLLLKSETELCKLKLGWDNDIPIMYLRKWKFFD